jgi:hypothetical protein
VGDRIVAQLCLLSLLFCASIGCHARRENQTQMEMKDLLAAVRNDRIQFATLRPPGSQFTILERRVIVTGPPELVELSASHDPQVLTQLVELLRNPDRAWAAEVLLAAITDHESKIVDVFAATPDEWWDAVGKTAHERWVTWLSQSKQN